MKTLIRIFALLIVTTFATHSSAWSQAEIKQIPNGSRISVGISAGHYRYDPGIAIDFTTKAVFQHHLSLRLRGGIQWSEAHKATYGHWASYRSFATAIVYNGQLFERTRFYAEFGLLGIVPNLRFSDEDFLQGFYEFNGLEITLLSKPDYALCIYLGAGPAFIDAHAEKIEGRPAYGNRIHFINGVRVYF